MASNFIQLPSAADVTAGVASFKGRTGAVVPATGDYAVAQVTGLTAALDGKQSIQNDETTVYAITAEYPTIQDAIDHAETLAASDAVSGATVCIPGGNYAEDLIIRKNVNLVGLVAGGTRIQSVTYRPSSNSAGPEAAKLMSVSIDTLTAVAETANASGVFWTSMFFEGPLQAIGCELNAVVLNRLNNVRFDNCFGGPANDIDAVDCADVRLSHCNLGVVSFSIDGTDSNLPVKIDPIDANYGILFVSESIVQGDLTISRPDGTTGSFLVNEGSFLYNLIANDGSSLYVRGGQIYSRTLNGTVDVAEYTSSSPFKPTTPADWDVEPTSVDEALNELAARIAVLEP